jgi:hypothetical protein
MAWLRVDPSAADARPIGAHSIGERSGLFNGAEHKVAASPHLHAGCEAFASRLAGGAPRRRTFTAICR